MFAYSIYMSKNDKFYFFFFDECYDIMVIYLGFNRVKNIYLYIVIVDVYLRGLVDRLI